MPSEDTVQKTEQFHEMMTKNLLKSFLQYKQYYDSTAATHPLQVNDFYNPLHPEANTQGFKIPFTDFLWIVSQYKTHPDKVDFSHSA